MIISFAQEIAIKPYKNTTEYTDDLEVIEISHSNERNRIYYRYPSFDCNLSNKKNKTILYSCIFVFSSSGDSCKCVITDCKIISKDENVLDKNKQILYRKILTYKLENDITPNMYFQGVFQQDSIFFNVPICINKLSIKTAKRKKHGAKEKKKP